MTEVQEGEMIAVYLPQYRDELPTIGKVVSFNEEGAKVEVEWYVGSYTGVWRVVLSVKGEQWYLGGRLFQKRAFFFQLTLQNLLDFRRVLLSS